MQLPTNSGLIYNFRWDMTLIDWIELNGGRGSGAVRRLEHATGVSHATLTKVLAGKRMRDVGKARALSRATGFRVTVRELLHLTDEDIGPDYCTQQHRRRKAVA